MKRQSILSLAEKQALRSLHEFRHGAILVKDGQIIGSGFNKYSNHIPKNARGRSSLHAEEAAIKKLVSSKSCENARMYVVRVASYGLANSKPCARCQNLMKNFGVKQCVYSTQDGIEKMFL